MQAIPSATLPDELSRLGVNRGPAGTPAERTWTLASLSGRFVELSGTAAGAALSAAVALVHEAQLSGEPSAWIALGGSTFYPPDVAATGIDLSALPVVCVEEVRAALRAADHLLRSGGFAVIVLDLGAESRMRMAAQSRLAGLARTHQTVLLCLTRKRADDASIGSLVSIRGEVTAEKTGFDRFRWSIHILKDKRRGPGWAHSAECRGPDGFC